MESPEQVIQRQLDAFNAKDLEALLKIYADDAEMYEYPDKLLSRGATALRERFTLRFQEPNLHAALLNRIVMGDTVIDYEKIARTFPEGRGSIEVIMIYEVAAGRIIRASMKAGSRILDA